MSRPPAQDDLRPLLSQTGWAQTLGCQSEAPRQCAGPRRGGAPLPSTRGTKLGQRRQTKSLRKRFLQANEGAAGRSRPSASLDGAFDPGLLAPHVWLFTATSGGEWQSGSPPPLASHAGPVLRTRTHDTCGVGWRPAPPEGDSGAQGSSDVDPSLGRSVQGGPWERTDRLDL